MARLVAAFGSSHSPALNSPAEDMAGHARRDEMFQGHLDREGRKVSYADLESAAGERFKTEIAPEKLRERIAACERHIERLSQAIAAAKLDALVIVGDDQREQYLEDNQPAFLVYCGESIENGVMAMPQESPEYWRRARSQYYEPDAPRRYPVAAKFAEHLTAFFTDEGFDVAYGKSLPRARGEGHAFGFVHRRLLRGAAPPIVPLVVNTYYPPNQPRPRRCYRLGRALAKATEAFSGKQRIGVIASGGLSHFTVDEELDRRVLSACENADGEALSEIPVDKLNSGSSEIRNWIVAAGAAAELRMKWREYVPLYRTPAGTGCGMAFAEWG
jgi:3-O-methylgallate 3,4-dioxygenase